MRYNFDFEDFTETINLEVQRAEEHRHAYTPNNLEQIYKANNLDVLLEIQDLCKYYNYNTQNSDTKLCMMFEFLSQKYIDEKNKLYKMLQKTEKTVMVL